MKWHKTVEYRTSLVVDGEEYYIVARKEGDDEFFGVEINNDYVADCELIPTREYLEQIIEQENEISRRTSVGSYNGGE